MIKEARIKAEFKTNIEDVWKIITNREDISWRPDIEKVEVVSEIEFKEITRAGVATNYKVEESEEYSLYRLKMNNQNIKGVFEASFEEVKGGGCNVEIYQKNEMLSLSSKIASILFVSLEKLQNRYVYDIKNRLNEL